MSQSENVCLICGMDYVLRNGRFVCPACGAYKPEEQTGEKSTLAYMAARELRLCDFDRAERAYADFIEKYPDDPTGYWGRLMARYGIRYEEEPDGRRIPTCYAASLESVTADKDYLRAVELADEDMCAYYRNQAGYMERVRTEWVTKASGEKPYDVFLSYKESDPANGYGRTPDSVAAQDLYIHLTGLGYRVFFSRESLRGKEGEKYEPYIFNAIMTSRVMLVLGSRAEYINATWVKNEWTRFDKRRAAGEKAPDALMVICDGFSPAELPAALASRQCFDATRRTFYGDLDAAIKRVLEKSDAQTLPFGAAMSETGGSNPGDRTGGGATEEKKHRAGRVLSVVIPVLAVVLAALLLVWIKYGDLLKRPPEPNKVGFVVSEDGSILSDPSTGVRLTGPAGTFTETSTMSFEVLTSGETYERILSDLITELGADRIVDCAVWRVGTDVPFTGSLTVEFPLTGSLADTVTALLPVYDANDAGKLLRLDSVSEKSRVSAVTERRGYLAAVRIAPGTDIVVIPEHASSVTADKYKGHEEVIECVVPDSVMSIGGSAFEDCSSLEKVYFGDGLLTLGDRAFCGCGHLTDPDLPASLILIGAGAFENCLGLKDVVLPEGVQFLDSRAFFGCSEMTSITIPAGVRSIGQDAFYGCSRLRTVYYEGTVEQWRQIAFGNRDANPLTYAPRFYVNGEQAESPELFSVSYAEDRYFAAAPDTVDLVIPEGTRMLMESQFMDCKQIRSVTLPDSLIVIGSHAFRGCENLEKVVMGKNVVLIEDRAFDYCPRLREIDLPEGLICVCESAFNGNSSLETLVLPDSLKVMEERAFEFCSGLTSVRIGEGLTHIGDYAFQMCGGLSEVSLSESVVSIGEGAFIDCGSMTSMHIPAGVTQIGSLAFLGCKRLKLTCEASAAPVGWNVMWNPDSRSVKWDVKPGS